MFNDLKEICMHNDKTDGECGHSSENYKKEPNGKSRTDKYKTDNEKFTG